MQQWMDRFKEWAPREQEEKTTPEDHMKKMYSFGQIGSKWLYFNPVVTFVAAGCVIGFVIWAGVTQVEAYMDVIAANAWICDTWNWLYLISQNFWICILLYILFKFYDLKLGKEEDEPEFSDLSYFSMLFASGVATGLWYFAAEAMLHYEGLDSPRWMDRQMFNDNTRAEHAVMVAFYHWGIHGWIPYTVVGALVSIMTYRRGFPMCMRFTLYPLIGEMCYGFIGDMIEVLSILCTVFGLCTSLGLGSMQINKGLMRLDRGTYLGKDTIGCQDPTDRVCKGNTGLESNSKNHIIIIVVLTLLATASVVSGLKRGIKVLSAIAFAASFFIMLSVLFLDETWFILNVVTSAFGYFMWYLPKISFHTDAFEELGAASEGMGGAPDGRGGAKGWMTWNTLFLWGAWVSWGPFVGTYLARISKGRKLGHFIIGTLILPTLYSFMFIGVMGASTIRMSNQAIAAGLDGSSPGHIYGHLANSSVGNIGYNRTYKTDAGVMTWEWIPVPDGVTRLYSLKKEDILFEHLSSYGGEGWGTFITLVTLSVIVIYFITSSDSASFVCDILAANGVVEPPLLQKIFWAFVEGAAACALLGTASDENPGAPLKAVQIIPVILGLPLTFLLFWICQGLVIVCKEEVGELKIGRKHFRTFLFNLEPISYASILVPFYPLGIIAEMCWGYNKIIGWAAFGSAWLCMIVFIIVGAADDAFFCLGASMYFIFAFLTAGLRTSVRTKLGISGDMISDICACSFALPWAIGQMYAEEPTKTSDSSLKTSDSSLDANM